LKFPKGSFGGSLTKNTIVSQPHTRKSFFARVGALLTASIFVPKSFAKSASQAVQHPQQGVRFQLKPEARAVVRDADSV